MSDGTEVLTRGAAAGGGPGGPCSQHSGSSSPRALANSPWLLVELGRLTPGSRPSENGMDSLEQALRAVVLAASNIEAGFDPDEVFEC